MSRGRGPPDRPWSRHSLQQLVEGVEAGPVGLAQMRPERLFALVVVIAGRAFPPEFPVGNRGLADDPDPLVLGLLAGFHGCGSARQRFLDDTGDVTALLLEHRGGVRRHAGLGEAGEELVGETVAHHAMKRPVAVGPVIVERQAVAALDRVNAEAAPELGRDLEAAGKDDAVDFIFDSIGDDPRLGDPLRRLWTPTHRPA